MCRFYFLIIRKPLAHGKPLAHEKPLAESRPLAYKKGFI
jgi:hypothetical protein